MSAETSQAAPEHVARMKLFIGSCMSLIATSVAFAVVGDVLGALKQEFVLTNEQVGFIGGAALWGFAISQFAMSPFVDKLGFRPYLRLSFLGHLLGPIIMITANGFWMLFVGALIIAFANGLVEASTNPLVATLFPDNKTSKLNQFHVWFPGGIVLGGLAAFGLRQIGVGFIGSWESIIALIFIPTVIYGFMMLNAEYPESENVQSGVSMGEMFKATLRPMFIVIFITFIFTASIELGPNRWIPAVLQAGGIPGILVLVWISGIMAVLRYNAHFLVEKFSPPGLLLFSSVTAGIGLYLFSFAESTVVAFATATIFAVGVCFIWPTMLGFANEQVPKSGALGLGLLGGVGMLVVGAVTSPLMGTIADARMPEQLPNQQTVQVLERTVENFPEYKQQVAEDRQSDVQTAINIAQEALNEYEQTNELPGIETANALRAITGSSVEAPVVDQAQELLGPADNYGGRMAFRIIAPFALIPTIVFLVIFLQFKKEGGYSVKRIDEE
jgi:fucose permease